MQVVITIFLIVELLVSYYLYYLITRKIDVMRVRINTLEIDASNGHNELRALIWDIEQTMSPPKGSATKPTPTKPSNKRGRKPQTSKKAS